MSTPSNLYAEKIFSEHPTALWALDDPVDYLSLITENQRNMVSWTTPINGSVSLYSGVSNQPFALSSVFKIRMTEYSDNLNYTTLVSPDITNFSNLSSDLGTFSIGTYINSISPYIAEVAIGFEYNSSYTGELIQNIKNYTMQISDSWNFISETFDKPDDNTTFRIVIRIGAYSGGSDSDYDFLINGLTVGQWSEEFNSSSLGISSITLPSTISILGGSRGYYAKAYGLDEDNGYYIINSNILRARNNGIPLCYGSSNLTSVYPNGELPSLIIPGKGFLNEVGKYQDYTAEFWLRVNSDSVSEKRIFGPIASDDGLYVNGPFIMLKVNNNIQSHYVGEWYRPMLIDIRVLKNSASLLINGEEVFSMSFQTSDLVFPEEYSSDDKNQNWLGFWSYEDVTPMEIDCFALYSYSVSQMLAKRRFAYGQAVEFPENINTSYSGSSVYIDYPFADYTSSYSYPDLGNWNQGYRDNLSITGTTLSNTEYSIPEIVLENKTEKQFYLDCASVQNESENFFAIQHNNSSQTNGHMLFNKFEYIQDPVYSFYGIFKKRKSVLGKETLIRFQSDQSNDYFEICLDGNEISYELKYNESLDVLAKSISVPIGEKFIAGMNIQKFIEYHGGNVATFFGNRQSLKIYLGGNKLMENTFHGNIYKFGLLTERNFQDISQLFNEETGLPLLFDDVFEIYLNSDLSLAADSGLLTQSQVWDYYMDGGSKTLQEYSNSPDDTTLWPEELPPIGDHVASYTLFATTLFEEYILDVAVQGYWEDNLPLTYLSQYVTDSRGKKYYDLDFIQFNLNYPAPSKFIQESVESDWSYAELQEKFSVPIVREYSSLDNHLFTGYENYTDLQNNSLKTFRYDTSDSLVKSYVTFQYTETGASQSDSYFIYKEKASKYGVVEPGENWINTKYEVVNNMLIYPPKDADILSLSIVYSLNFVVRGLRSGRIKLKNLQLCSQAFNATEPNAVGTRFGNNIYPYKKLNYYYNYKSRNPFTIYKGSTPYLYLTRFSGIELKDQYDPKTNRGLAIPINESESDNYKISSIQMAIRFDQDFFPYSEVQIFQIESKNELIKVYMKASQRDGKRAKIYAVNASTGQVDNGISFYINGNVVREPHISVKEWAFLGINFTGLLDFQNSVGSLNLTGPLTFNTISYYKSTHLQEIQQRSTRPWFRILGNFNNEIPWDFWRTPTIKWNGVLVFSTKNYYGVDPSDVYKSYTGTDKIIIDSDKVFSITGYKYTIYGDVEWQQSVLDAL